MGANHESEIGIIGLGVMGENLLLNIHDHGFRVAGYDKDLGKAKDLQTKTIHVDNVLATNNIADFVKGLKKPRAILLLVPAGKIVDDVIQNLLPYLEKEDLIIDAGNSYFKDTESRELNLKSKGIQFLGMGVSGGEEGARQGPSLMPGGTLEAFRRVEKILVAIAAKVGDEPCVTYIGKGGSGHYVKMLHNGIEYGIMQLIAESYDVMKRGLGFSNEQIQEQYSRWNEGELNSYLIEVASKIFNKEEGSGKKLIDTIKDVAQQNGTGLWTVESAMELQVPVPIIDAAVWMRDLSGLTQERSLFASKYSSSLSSHAFEREGLHNKSQLIQDLELALLAGIILVYSQGMALLKKASEKYGYSLNLQAIARIWRGGCIIRSKLLEDISIAFQKKSDLPNLLLDENLSIK